MTTYNSDDAIRDVEGADYATLKAKFKDLAAVVDILHAERKAAFDEIRKREKEVAIKLRLGTLSEADKVLYRDVINSPTFSRN